MYCISDCLLVFRVTSSLPGHFFLFSSPSEARRGRIFTAPHLAVLVTFTENKKHCTASLK